MLDSFKENWEEAKWTARLKATRRKKGMTDTEKMVGRPTGWLYGRVAEGVRERGYELPQPHVEDGVVVVPDNFLGLMALIARADCLLTDDELVNLDEVWNQLWPMGEKVQAEVEEKDYEILQDRNGVGP